MEARCKHAMFRWSFMTGGLTALFWAIYWLVVGSVPTNASEICLTDSWKVMSPGISHWWDIVVVSALTALTVFFYFVCRKSGKEDRFWIQTLSGVGVLCLICAMIFYFHDGLLGCVEGVVMAWFFVVFAAVFAGIIVGIIAGIVWLSTPVCCILDRLTGLKAYLMAKNWLGGY